MLPSAFSTLLRNSGPSITTPSGMPPATAASEALPLQPQSAAAAAPLTAAPATAAPLEAGPKARGASLGGRMPHSWAMAVAVATLSPAGAHKQMGLSHILFTSSGCQQGRSRGCLRRCFLQKQQRGRRLAAKPQPADEHQCNRVLHAERWQRRTGHAEAAQRSGRSAAAVCAHRPGPPVSILTVMPDAWHCLMAAGTSARSGSSMPTKASCSRRGQARARHSRASSRVHLATVGR